jgi:hypothetical protein
MKNTHDLGNILVIALTFALFTIALFTTDLLKDLLLEAGVLLVSIKIIMMNRATAIANREILNKLDKINEKLMQDKN